MALRAPLAVPVACAALALAGVAGAPSVARAQEAGAPTGTTENINSMAVPERWLLVNGAYEDVTETPRSSNLNPEGVNYSDCEGNLRVDFTMTLSGFEPADMASMQVWAGTVLCTQPSYRDPGAPSGAATSCWKVAADTGPVTAVSADTVKVSIYARDVLRYESAPVSSAWATYDPSFHGSSASEGVCTSQPTDAAIPLTLYFIPVDSAGNVLGTSFSYPLVTDTVGPPPPDPVTVDPGDTLVQVNWTIPNDPDVAGLVVYSDPPAPQASTNGCTCGQTAGGGQGPPPDAGDAQTTEYPCGMDATTGSIKTADGGTITCQPITVSGETACIDPTLTDNSFVVGGGSMPGDDASVPEASMPGDASVPEASMPGDASKDGAATDAATTDDAAEASTSPPMALAGGGISNVPSKYQSSVLTAQSGSTVTLSGLSNYVTYKVVVASTDGSGNTGPVSELACGYPQPVSDYWNAYKEDGGGTNGCAFEGRGANAGVPAFGVGLLAAGATFVRRRRRRSASPDEPKKHS